MGGGPVNDRSTQAHLASQAGATPHKYCTVLENKQAQGSRRPPGGLEPEAVVDDTVCTVMPQLCQNYAMPAREGTLPRAPRGRCRAAWQLQRDTNKAHQQQAVRSRPTDTWSHGQTTLSGDFLGHMQGRGMGLPARREVGDSPAEGDEGQGSCRSDSWTMQKHADGCGTRTQPPQCLRVGSLQHCQLHSLQNEAKPMRESVDDWHTCTPTNARQSRQRQPARTMPRQECRYQDRFDSG